MELRNEHVVRVWRSVVHPMSATHVCLNNWGSLILRASLYSVKWELGN